MDSLVTVAAIAARLAGEELLSRFNDTPKNLTTKAHQLDFASDADREAEKIITEIILNNFPNDKIIGEEGTRIGNNHSKLSWFIDPLDGTTNFLYGLHTWGVSIGVKENDEIIAGIVYQPTTEEMWIAQKGKGAFKNYLPLTAHVRPEQPWERSLGIVGAHVYKGTEERRKKLDKLFASKPRRSFGSAALHLAYLAEGRGDYVYHEIDKLSDWDVSAGACVCREMGLIADWYPKGEGGTAKRFIAGKKAVVNEIILATN